MERRLDNSRGASGYFALGDLIVAIARADDRASLFEAVASHVPNILTADRASVALLNPARDAAEVYALEGARAAVPIGKILPLGETLIGEAVLHRITGSWDVSEHLHYIDARALSAHGMRWILNAPIEADAEIIGTINVATMSPAGYPPHDVYLLTQVASLVSSTLQRQSLMASTHHAAHRSRAYAEKLEALTGVARALSTAMTEVEVFDAICAAMNRIVLSDRISLAVLDGDGVHVQMSMLRGRDHVLGAKARFPLAGTGLQCLFDGAEPVYWPAFEPDVYPDQARLHQLGLRSGISLPIVRHGGVVASLNLACHQPDSMSREERTVLAMLADLMSVTLDRVHIAQMLDAQARHDALTGLPNRREFDRQLQASVADRKRATASDTLCFIDIDHFKTINDTYGHHCGDAVLKAVTEQMLAVIPTSDMLARVGGDEFALLVRQCRFPDAMRVAERLRRAVGDLSVVHDNRRIDVTLSIGVAEVAPRGSADEVVSDADAACYLSKRAGRNRVTAAGSVRHRIASRRSDSQQVNLIKNALAGDGFTLYAQPIVSLTTRQVCTYELLIRMYGENGQLVAPAEFIPVAERWDLITRIDRWVFEQALEWITTGAGAGRREACSINLSSTSMESDDFLAMALEAVSVPGVPADRLCFEITERVAVCHVAKAARFIEALSALGCRFALDDFGSGFSSFSALKSLPVDEIKIDGSLVREVTSSRIDNAAVRAIVELATALEATTVAEFIENESTGLVLLSLGVTQAQGFHFGRPVPLDSLVLSEEAVLVRSA